MDTMKITVYTLHHGVHYFYLPINSQVYQLRQSLQNRINVPLEHLRITHHFNYLSDDDILPDNNVFMVHECPKVTTRSSSLGRIADLLLKCSSLHTNTGKGKGKGKKCKSGERGSGGERSTRSAAGEEQNAQGQHEVSAAGPSGSGGGSLDALNPDALNASLQAALDTWPASILRPARQEQFALTLSTYLWTEPEDASTPEDSSSSESPEPMELEVEPTAGDTEPWVMPIRVWRHDEVYKMRRAARLATRPPRLHGAVALLNNVVEWVLRHRPAEVHLLSNVARWAWQCERPTQRLLHHMAYWLSRREGGLYVPPHIRRVMTTVMEPLQIKCNPMVLRRTYQSSCQVSTLIDNSPTGINDDIICGDSEETYGNSVNNSSG